MHQYTSLDQLFSKRHTSSTMWPACWKSTGYITGVIHQYRLHSSSRLVSWRRCRRCAFRVPQYSLFECSISPYSTYVGGGYMPPAETQRYGPHFQTPNGEDQQPFFQYSQCNGRKKALCVSWLFCYDATGTYVSAYAHTIDWYQLLWPGCRIEGLYQRCTQCAKILDGCVCLKSLNLCI